MSEDLGQGDVMFFREGGVPHLVGAEICLSCASSFSVQYPRPCLRQCDGQVHSEIVGRELQTRCDACAKEEL